MARGGPGPRLNARVNGRYHREAAKNGKAYLEYLAEVDRLLITMTASGLESGMGNSEAATLAIHTWKEIEILARDSAGNLLPDRALHIIYTFACAILASGTTFASFDIAQRSVSAYQLMERQSEELMKSWDPEAVDDRMRAQAIRRERTLESHRKLREAGVTTTKIMDVAEVKGDENGSTERRGE
jgi:hypothetical protein